MSLEACLGRQYKLEKSENFEEFLKAFGVGYLIRKMAQVVNPYIELKRDGDTYTLTSSSSFKHRELKFRLGEEFEEERHDGTLVKAVITLQDESTLFHRQMADDGKSATVTRHFTPEQVTITMRLNDVICKKIYKAV
ncbi:fatty acid-binding protein-like [Schistocerca cancellata]|uniref:fatty acid-binding protein-like n=1 Tax=Schistocerca cancellata TaxID=274614 RepID=UPI0021197C6B|nr:fatty acid-binding protein-like [Schistocerca cancellata]